MFPHVGFLVVDRGPAPPLAIRAITMLNTE
jgi:hypothetical protein